MTHLHRKRKLFITFPKVEIHLFQNTLASMKSAICNLWPKNTRSHTIRQRRFSHKGRGILQILYLPAFANSLATSVFRSQIQIQISDANVFWNRCIHTWSLLYLLLNMYYQSLINRTDHASFLVQQLFGSQKTYEYSFVHSFIPLGRPRKFSRQKSNSTSRHCTWS